MFEMLRRSMAGFSTATLLAACTILSAAEGECASKDADHLYRVELAILDLTSRNQAPYVETFALQHTFDILGLPYAVTTDVKEATGYKVIYTGGTLSNQTLSPEEADLLYSFVESGGILVSAVVSGNRYYPLFGIGATESSNRRFWVSFDPQAGDGALKYVDREEEKRIRLGDPNLYKEIIWSHSFKTKGARTLARMEDDSTILSVHYYGQGLAYALGLAYADVILTPQVGRGYEAQRQFINVFEPGADVFMLILKAIYEEALDPYVYLSTIPYGRETAFILTHDVDAQDSFKNAVEYARMEKSHGVKSTFFITTKYFIDETDIDYYAPVRIGYIKQLKEMGFDIGSHTVAHSKTFGKFPIGVPEDTRKTYDPRVAPSVFGEVKVSKELLDRDIPKQQTVSFRAGDLAFPDALIEVLEKSGYRYDSTFSGADILTNFAYRALRRRDVTAPESTVVEIPVIFDDSQGLLTADNWHDIVARWLDIIWANRDNEAISVLLIHPSITSYRLKAEEEVLKNLAGKDVWVGDLTSYGDFWNERSKVKYKTILKDGLLTIRLEGGDIPPVVSFVVKDSPSVKEVKVISKQGRELQYQVLRRGGKAVLRTGSLATNRAKSLP